MSFYRGEWDGDRRDSTDFLCPYFPSHWDTFGGWGRGPSGSHTSLVSQGIVGAQRWDRPFPERSGSRSADSEATVSWGGCVLRNLSSSSGGSRLSCPSSPSGLPGSPPSMGSHLGSVVRHPVPTQRGSFTSGLVQGGGPSLFVYPSPETRVGKTGGFPSTEERIQFGNRFEGGKRT